MLKTPAPFAIADEQEFDFRISAHEFRRDGEQIIVALELEQPRDFADDEIVRRDAEGFAEFQIIFRRKKRFERKAAENFRVLLRPSDAGGEVLRFHRVGDDDEMGRGAGGLFFGGAENKIAQARFENFRTTGRESCG